MKEKNKNSKEKTIVHILPSFHYDLAFRKTFRGYLPQSFAAIDKALELMEKYEDFVFNIEQVVLLREYWKKHPEKHKLMKKFAAQKRLVSAPGMFTMPDSNIPSGESFIRNTLLGRKWLWKNLNIEPECCWMADVFGHNPQSPQLAGTCGFKSYMFERGKAGSWNTTFLWKGIDGTAIPAHWEIDTYYGINLALLWLKDRPFEWVGKRLDDEVIGQLRKNSPCPTLLLSKMGGDFKAPEEEEISAIKRINRESSSVQMIFSTPEKYFSELKKRSVKLKKEARDMNPLCEGCCSSRIRLKLYNRRLEEKAATLELLESMSGKTPSHGNSEKLWELICWNAFHDIICGTLENRAYRQALKKYQNAEKRVQKNIDKTLENFIRKEHFSADEGSLFFNSLPYPRQEIVRVPGPGRSRFQKIKIPPCETFFVGKNTKECRNASVRIRKNGYIIENNLLKIEIGENGTVKSLYDKENRQELAGKRGMNNPVIKPDYGDLWMLDSGPINPSLLRTGPYKASIPVSGTEIIREGRIYSRAVDADCMTWPKPKIKDKSPLQSSIEINYEQLGFKTEIILRDGEKIVRFISRYIPQGMKKRLICIFPTSIRSGRIRHSVPCGHIERPEGEYAVQGWMDYSDSEKGLLLLNKGTPGNSVNSNTMILSLFRAVAMEDSDRKPWYEEGEEHVFEYALMPFNPNDPAYNPARTAAIFNRDIESIDIDKNFAGKRKKTKNNIPFLELKGAQAEISCIKKDKNILTLRLWESSGKKGEAVLIPEKRILECIKSDAAETEFREIRFSGNKIPLQLNPFEIITLKITLDQS